MPPRFWDPRRTPAEETGMTHDVLRDSLYKCPFAEVKMEPRRTVGKNTPSDSNQPAVNAHAKRTMQHWAYVTSGTVSSRVVTTYDAIPPK